jgi:hypothetical protein
MLAPALIDYKKLFTYAKQSGLKIFVEQGLILPLLESTKNCINYIKGML